VILIDFNGLVIPTIFATKIDIEESLVRGAILNCLRIYRNKFNKQYGELVICCDKGNWRQQYFANYKCKRADERDESAIDWTALFKIFNTVLDEIRENLPYRVVEVPGCEADDVIAVICETTQEFGQHDEVMIVSTDKDFAQLQKFKNIRQFSPVQKKFIVEPNPRKNLFTHICKGDSVDSVPNVMSGDDVFLNKERQNKMMATKIAEWEAAIDIRAAMGEDIYRNYLRNKKMIDLTEIPDDMVSKIISTFESQVPAAAGKVMPYFMKTKNRLLLEHLNDFIN
jgi:hypothetical protein